MKLSDKNRLSIVRLDLSREWDLDKNYPLTPMEVSYGSARRVWWKCSVCSCVWEAAICDRSFGNGCPKCKRKIPNISNNLMFKNPTLSKEWNYKKNNGLSPVDFTYNSHKVVWWICKKCGYEWKESINKRVQTNNSCFNCRSLAIRFPDLIKEWNTQRNGDLTPFNVTYSSKKKVWWICGQCRHEWKTDPSHRVNGRNCPSCKKVKLKNGVICDSWVEAFVYLEYLKSGIAFMHNLYYGDGMGKRRYDFYIPSENKFVEVTSFKHGSIGISWFKYLRNIVLKKKYVENILGAKFEFKNIFLTYDQIKFVKNELSII